MIRIEKVPPSSDLIGLVKQFIVNETTEFFAPQAVPPWTKKILTFQYQDRVKIRYRHAESATYEMNIHGNVMEPYWFLPTQGHIGILSVEFTDLGFFHFLREDIQQFNAGIISLTETISAKQTQNICEQLNDLPSSLHKVQVVETFLRRRFDMRRSPGFDQVARICEIAEGKIPLTNIRNLATDVGLTDRHLRRKFRQMTGLAPKKYMQMQRMNRALFRKAENPDTDWATIAYFAGYADQAHLSRDFSAHLGISPKHIQFDELQMSRIYR